MSSPILLFIWGAVQEHPLYAGVSYGTYNITYLQLPGRFWGRIVQIRGRTASVGASGVLHRYVV